MRTAGQEADVSVSIVSTKRGIDLKNEYLKLRNRPEAKIRLFCLGSEIEDHMRLSDYKLDDDYVLIVMFSN